MPSADPRVAGGGPVRSPGSPHRVQGRTMRFPGGAQSQGAGCWGHAAGERWLGSKATLPFCCALSLPIWNLGADAARVVGQVRVGVQGGFPHPAGCHPQLVSGPALGGLWGRPPRRPPARGGTPLPPWAGLGRQAAAPGLAWRWLKPRHFSMKGIRRGSRTPHQPGFHPAGGH